MKRIFQFLITNLAVLALLTLVIFIIERVFGVHLAGGGLGGLLVFAAVCGFGGARRNAALVRVSTGGLLRSMSRSQIEAVLGHEITHVANGDMVTHALLQGVLNTFVIFLARIIGSFIDRMRLFMSHPPLDEGIAALQSPAG
jgi:Zn-dependent protease with chaperone function